MELNIGKKYILRIDVAGNILTYHALILLDDNEFVQFIDREGKTLTYNKKNLVSWEEV